MPKTIKYKFNKATRISRSRDTACRLKSALPSGAGWILSTVVIFLVTLGPVFTQSPNAQPLDDVLERLLDDDGNNNLCVNLIGAGATPTGALDVFCDQGGSGTPSASGGGASTPQTAPGIVQERMQVVRTDQGESSEPKAVTELTPGWSVFLSAEYESLDRDVTTFEDGYDSDIGRLTVGTDYQLTEKATAGLALTYSNHDGDLNGGGDFDNDSFGVIVFASIVPHESFFVQATLGYADNDYERSRLVTVDFTTPLTNPIDDLVDGKFDGEEFSTGFLFGYDYTKGNMTIGPRIGLDWIYTKFDGYTEKGDTGLELVFDDADETSFQSRLGFAGSLAISTGFGVLVPQVSADWVHEYADDQRDQSFSFAGDSAGINFSFEDEEPDRNFFELAVGVSAVLPNGWLPFVQFRTITGHEFLDSYVGAVGLRIEI